MLERFPVTVHDTDSSLKLWNRKASDKHKDLDQVLSAAASNLNIVTLMLNRSTNLPQQSNGNGGKIQQKNKTIKAQTTSSDV